MARARYRALFQKTMKGRRATVILACLIASPAGAGTADRWHGAQRRM